jgi:hypothetical protein
MYFYSQLKPCFGSIRLQSHGIKIYPTSEITFEINTVTKQACVDGRKNINWRNFGFKRRRLSLVEGQNMIVAAFDSGTVVDKSAIRNNALSFVPTLSALSALFDGAKLWRKKGKVRRQK